MITLLIVEVMNTSSILGYKVNCGTVSPYNCKRSIKISAFVTPLFKDFYINDSYHICQPKCVLEQVPIYLLIDLLHFEAASNQQLSVDDIADGDCRSRVCVSKLKG